MNTHKSETQSPEEATHAILAIAQGALNAVHEDAVNEQYRELTDAWDSERLFEGSISEIESVIKLNLDRISQENGFRCFIIECNNDEGYAGIMARFPRSVVPIRLWRTDAHFYLCGNRLFKDESSSLKVAATASPQNTHEQTLGVLEQPSEAPESAEVSEGLTRRNGRSWYRVLNIALVVAWLSAMYFLWGIASFRTWARVLLTIVLAVVFFVAWLVMMTTTRALLDCPRCGRTLRLKKKTILTEQLFSAKNIQLYFLCPKCGFTKTADYSKDF
jgi:uncharacterized C2H2 Zn-finger protein